jgi:hypothetical protein
VKVAQKYTQVLSIISKRKKEFQERAIRKELERI